MPNIPEYQMKTTDLTNRYTSTTGPEYAPLTAFDPFSDQAGEKLTQGLDAVAGEQNQRETKEDMVWAQAQYMKQQVNWATKIPGYTDPDALNKDLTSQTQEVMNTAPTGRASDFFVAHMNALAPRLMRRTMLNQAKAQVGATTQQFKDACDLAATTATGSPLPDTSAQPPTDGSAAPQPDSLVPRPMLSSAGLREVYGQTDQFKAAATGVIPTSTLNQTDTAVKTAVSKGIIQAASIEDGPGAIAAQLEKNPDDVIPSDSPLKTSGDLEGIINNLRLQDRTNLGVATMNAHKVLAKDISMTDQGQYPGDDVVQTHANMMGTIMAGAKGKKADEETESYLLQVKGAQDAYNFKTGLVGLTPAQADQKLNDFVDQHGDDVNAQGMPVGGHSITMATNAKDKLLTTLAKSPADYPLASNNYRDAYNSAYSQLQHDPANPDVVAHFQNVLEGGITIQNQARGITNDSTPEDIARATSSAGVIPEDTAKSIVNTIQTGTTQAAAQQLHGIQDSYGSYSGNAMKDLMRQGLDAKYLGIASLRNNPGMEATAVNAINLDSPQKGKESANSVLALEDNTGQTTPAGTAVKNAVADAFKPYSDATSWNVDGIRQTASIQKMVESIAKYYMITRGTDAPTAAGQAYKDLIGSQFDTGTINNRNFLVTKQYVPDGDTQSVIDGATALLPQIAKQNAYDADIGFVFNKDNKDVTQTDKDEFQQALTKYGCWINTSDGKSLRLAVNSQQLQASYPQMMNLRASAGTDVSSVVDSKGKPIEIPLQAFQLNKWGDTSAYGNPTMPVKRGKDNKPLIVPDDAPGTNEDTGQFLGGQ